MRLHYLQHAPFEGPGHISAMAEKLGAELSATCLYAGQELPPVSSFDVLFILGGPMGVYDEAECPWLGPEKSFVKESIESGKRIIGI